MKNTAQIRVVIAAGAVGLGLLVAAGRAGAADATKPTYGGAPSKSGEASGSDYHATSNSNDYHADYHANYSATQDGRANQPNQPQQKDELPDPRQDARRFQDRDRFMRYPLGYRR